MRGLEPERGSERMSSSADGDVADAHGATILVAEDSDFFRGQIQRLIEGVGYKVLTADDGQSAWEMLDSHASEISLVTTDIEMPRLDGLGLTKRIRADARFDHLPIIALSTLASEEEMAHGLAIGLNDYQVKLDQDQLLESIGKALRRSRSEQSAGNGLETSKKGKPMTSISNMKIGKKITLVLGVIVVLLTGLSALSLWGIRTQREAGIDANSAPYQGPAGRAMCRAIPRPLR